MTLLENFTADHKFLVEAAARAASIEDPIAFSPDAYLYHLLQASVRGPLIPLDGVLIRSWQTGNRLCYPGYHYGVRLYSVSGITFAQCSATLEQSQIAETYQFFVVARTDYVNLFRIAYKASRERTCGEQPPVMSPEQLANLRRNTIDYLDRKNLKRIQELGGRPKRGILLNGPPGNGKTSACRWLWQECLRLGYEYQMVSPDAYQAARHSCNPVQAVKSLFTVNRRGIIFFDDMDIALRDRNLVKETDDQAVFLSALDGIEVNEGVVYLFTTNCPLDLIDPAFKRPGRIDLVLHFQIPDAILRKALIDRWHPEIRNGIDLQFAVDSTEGLSFAEIDEIKNLLIVRNLDSQVWDWEWAVHQFRENRQEITLAKRKFDFATDHVSGNGQK